MSSTGGPGTRSVLLAAILCVLAGCGNTHGQAPRRILTREDTVGRIPVQLKSELSPARGTLGDPISWRLTATLGADTQPGATIQGPVPGSIELEPSRPPTWKRERGAVVWKREYVVRGFDLGGIALPQTALAIIAAGRADTLEFPRDTLFVDSLTPAATGAIRPDRGPIDTPLRPVDYLVVALAAILLAAAVAFLVRALRRARRRREVEAVPAPPEPPEAILNRSLTALESEMTSLPRDVFYERLALALKTYAAAVTGIPAADLTTTELARDLARDPRALPEGRETLIAALRRADLAKFARFEDEESEARSILRQARSVSGRLVSGRVASGAP